ncbi:hypothetical protein JGI20_01597 [Candidatus Kryptobacter tengchongensis]|nr:hypothetical protein JGI20_01597 [Candidatus Kryptobacter tengchongensis]
MEKLKKNLAIVLFAILIFNLSFSQNPEWINFTYGNYIRALAIEGDYIWVGTNGGLVKLNMLTGEKVYYTKASGLPSNQIYTIADSKLFKSTLLSQYIVSTPTPIPAKLETLELNLQLEPPSTE